MTGLTDAEVAELWSIVAVFADLAGAAGLIKLRPRPVHS
jgi:hypothetical protein